GQCMISDDARGSAKHDGKMTESTWEGLAMDELAELAWQPMAGKDIAPGSGHRKDWDDLILHDELKAAIERLNPDLPPTAVREAPPLAPIPASRGASPENKQAHAHPPSGVRLTYPDDSGAEQTPPARLADFHPPDANPSHAVTQVPLMDGDHHRRFDIVLY